MNQALISSYAAMKFSVAIYLRLSKEDEKEGHSESIKNQQDFLVKYVYEQGWSIYNIYVDDGYTGTNFDRPDFKKMIEDIEKKKVNLVITKDLSRLGRDHIDTSYYIEKYFPSKSVRYIAVNNNIDTFIDSGSNDIAPFINIVNDMYAKDISKKVRTAKHTKIHKGDFVGPFAPYGYMKDPANKNRLVPDPNTAPVVKKIYDMYTSGNGIHLIAQELQAQGIPIPTQYKYNKYPKYKSGNLKYPVWCHNTVASILRNPTYCGNLTQNRVTKINYKIKNLKTLSPEQWVTVEGTHEPIVTPEIFDIVQVLRSKRAPMGCVSNRKVHLLSGLLYCGDCGGKITFQKNQNGTTYTICSKYKRYMRTKVCSTHSMKEQMIEEFVKNDLKSIIKGHVDKKRMADTAKKFNSGRAQTDFAKEKINIQNQIERINNTFKELYDDKRDGVISRDDFARLSASYTKEREILNDRLKLLNEKNDNESVLKAGEEILKLAEKYLDFENPDRNLLYNLIDKIEIFEDKRILIHYKFKKP